MPSGCKSWPCYLRLWHTQLGTLAKSAKLIRTEKVFEGLSSHTSVFHTTYPHQGHGCDGVFSSWLWPIGGVHLGQVARKLEGTYIQYLKNCSHSGSGQFWVFLAAQVNTNWKTRDSRNLKTNNAAKVCWIANMPYLPSEICSLLTDVADGFWLLCLWSEVSEALQTFNQTGYRLLCWSML